MKTKPNWKTMSTSSDVVAKRLKKAESKAQAKIAKIQAFADQVKALNTEPPKLEESLLAHFERNKLFGNGDWFDADNWIVDTAYERFKSFDANEGIGAKFLRKLISQQDDDPNELLVMLFANIRATAWAINLLDSITAERRERQAQVRAARNNRCKCPCDVCKDQCHGFVGEELDADGEDILEQSVYTVLRILGESDEVERFFAKNQAETQK